MLRVEVDKKTGARPRFQYSACADRQDVPRRISRDCSAMTVAPISPAGNQ
jgi:hypothetical protein